MIFNYFELYLNFQVPRRLLRTVSDWALLQRIGARIVKELWT